MSAPANTSPQTTSTPAAPPAGGAPADAAGIEQQAHAAIQSGDYGSAIGALGGLVQRCPVAVTDPCAYAWYDLGYALIFPAATLVKIVVVAVLTALFLR